MAKKVSTKRKDTAQPEPTMLDMLNAQRFGDPEPDPVTEKTEGPSMDDLLAQINTLNSRVEEVSRTNLALMSTPPKVSTAAKAPELDMTNLPDPTISPDEFGKELAVRMRAQMQAENDARNTTSRTEQDFQTRLKGLWDEFNSSHPEYVTVPERVDFAAGQVVNRAKARGIDTERYMFTTRDQFLTDVSKEMEKVFGKNDNDDDNSDNDAPEANRTAGIFGGLESGGRPAKGGKTEAGDMISDLQDMQRKSGFF